MNTVDNLYLASPACIQNLALTLYGAKTYRQRFVGHIPNIYEDPGPPFCLPSAMQYEEQEKRLRLLIEHCVNYVPYYRELIGVGDRVDIGLDELPQHFPKLTKRALTQSPERFISTYTPYQKRLLKFSTSGTTASPLIIRSTPEARRINYSFYRRLLSEFGLNYRSKSTTLASRVLFRSDDGPVDRYDKFNRTQYLSIYTISRKTVRKYIDALNRWQPQFIDSHPSALFEIQHFAKQENLTLDIKPTMIITSSETLTPSVRTKIEDFFGTRIFDHYGCAEMAVSAFSDGTKYYANPLYSVLELEKKGDGVYSLIATGLLNFAMPLIRYEVGDYILTENPNNPYIFEGIEGRKDDIIITPEGKMIGRISSAFKGIEGLALAQVIQDRVDRLLVKVVIDPAHKTRFNETDLIENIKRHTSSTMILDVVYVEDIEKETNGKFKTVKNKLSGS